MSGCALTRSVKMFIINVQMSGCALTRSVKMFITHRN